MRRLLRMAKFGLLIVIGLIGVGLIGLAIANAPANAQIAERIAKLQAEGEPVTIADLGKNAPAAEDNAATYIDQATEDCLAIQDAVNEVWEKEEAERKKRGEKIDESFSEDPKMIEAYRAALAAHPQVIPLLLQAADCPRYHMKVNYEIDPPTAFVGEMLKAFKGNRAATRVLDYRVRLLLSEGKPEEALDTCLVMLRLSNLFAESPALVGQLVALAIRNVAVEATISVLQKASLSPEARRKLEAELARQNVRSAYRDSFRSERAVGLAYFDGGLPVAYAGLPQGKEDHLSYLDVMDVLLADADKAYEDPQAKERLQKVLKKAGPMTQALVPAIQATNEAVTRNEALLRCLRVLNALSTREPEDANEPQLSELGLPLDATTDPFNGKPLNLKRTDQGWTVYSVGKDLKDDGGLIGESMTDVGYGPIK